MATPPACSALPSTLLAFGAVANAGNRLALAALVTLLPAIAPAGMFALLPETSGHEPDEMWPGVP